MLTTITTLLDLLINLIQHPVLTIVCIGVCAVIMYAVEQRARP